MQWTRERDLLIAETMAFVRSVAGQDKPEEKQDAKSLTWTLPSDAARQAMEIVTTSAGLELPATKALGQTSRLDMPGDFPSEIRNRVAGFRAHQQRFDREREAHCRATMARIHAIIGDDSPDLPQRK